MNIKLSSKIARKMDSLPPYLKKEPLFRICKYLWYKKYFPSIVSSNTNLYIDKLTKDGFVVLDNLYNSSYIESLYKPINELLNSIKKNEYYEGYKIYKFPGIYRLLNCDNVFPKSSSFFDHPLINEIASSYVSKDISNYQKQAELRSGLGVQAIADTPHFDDWRHRLKALLYLDNVNEYNAPFIYYRGSHKNGKWNDYKRFEYFKYGKKGTYGHYSSFEISSIIGKYGLKPVKLIGKQGTVIIFDARGIHSSSLLQKNQRLTLASYFDVRNSYK